MHIWPTTRWRKATCLQHLAEPLRSEQSRRVWPTPICRRERELAAALGPRLGDSVRVHNDTFAILRAGLPSGAERAASRGVRRGHNCVAMTPERAHCPHPRDREDLRRLGRGRRARRGRPCSSRRAPMERPAPARPRWPAAAARPLRALLDVEADRGAAPGEDPGRTQARADARPCSRSAAAGDAVGALPVERQAEEIGPGDGPLTARLLEVETPVLLGGSVLAARHPQLDDAVRDCWRPGPPRRCRSWSPRRPCSRGASGARHISAPPDAYLGCGPSTRSREPAGLREPNGFATAYTCGERGRGAKGVGPPDTPRAQHDR